jgi:DNA-binding NarL/FixJ family response regulator
MSEGISNPAVAAQPFVGLGTVKRHILDKVGARNRIEAVTRGRAFGISC